MLNNTTLQTTKALFTGLLYCELHCINTAAQPTKHYWLRFRHLLFCFSLAFCFLQFVHLRAPERSTQIRQTAQINLMFYTVVIL